MNFYTFTTSTLSGTYLAGILVQISEGCIVFALYCIVRSPTLFQTQNLLLWRTDGNPLMLEVFRICFQSTTNDCSLMDRTFVGSVMEEVGKVSKWAESL